MSRRLDPVWFPVAILLACILLAACNGSAAPPPPDTGTEQQEPAVIAQEDAPFIGYTPESLLYVGDPQAPVTVYEMFNANCYACAHHHTQTLDQLIETYAVPGQVRFVFVDLALSSDWGEEAHFAAYCVGVQQGAEAEWQFWQDFYTDQRRWLREGSDFTTELATAAGSDLAGYRTCLETDARAAVYARQAVAENDLLPGRWVTPVFRLENRRGELLRSLSGTVPLEGWHKELERHVG